MTRSLPSFLSLLSLLSLVALAAGPTACSSQPAGPSLLHVSFDPTRELYDAINAAFIADWQRQTGEVVTVRQSHGGSGKQTRAVLDGLEADVVTLALAHDVDVLAQAGLVGADWQTRGPSAPFESTVVFLVRAGNPKGIQDWSDLVKDGVSVITPNPKTSGGARWVYLAAWSHAQRRALSTGSSPEQQEQAARAFVQELYRHVPVLDTGARGAATTFAERGLGDVLVGWESDARMLLAERPELQLVVPSSSVRAVLPAAVVDKHVDKHGTRALAEAYVRFLSSPAAQAIAAAHHFRPAATGAASDASSAFPAVARLPIEEIAGGWAQAHAQHFAAGGVYDVIALENAQQRTPTP